MAVNKSNHFVPQCYLRVFSGGKKYISLHNISKNITIQKASIKDQCARDYLYGKSGDLERVFSKLESKYAIILSSLIDQNFDPANFFKLRYFFSLQRQRSLAAITETHGQFAEIDKRLKGISRDHYEMQEMQLEEAMKLNIQHVNMVFDALSDLKSILLFNETDVDFICSDNPAIVTNKWLKQNRFLKADYVNCGVTNSGLICILPLSPRHCLFLYDKDVYHLPNLKTDILHLRKKSDASIINGFQYINAINNIYGAKISNDTSLHYNNLQNYRRKEWFRLNILKQVDENNGRQKFIKVPSDEDINDDDQLLFHTEKLLPVVPTWPSFLKNRSRPKFIDTGTGAGKLRPAHKDGFEEDF